MASHPLLAETHWRVGVQMGVTETIPIPKPKPTPNGQIGGGLATPCPKGVVVDTPNILFFSHFGLLNLGHFVEFLKTHRSNFENCRSKNASATHMSNFFYQIGQKWLIEWLHCKFLILCWVHWKFLNIKYQIPNRVKLWEVKFIFLFFVFYQKERR